MSTYIIAVIIGGGLICNQSSLDVPFMGIYFDEIEPHHIRSIVSPFRNIVHENSLKNMDEIKKYSKLIIKYSSYFQHHVDTGLYYDFDFKLLLPKNLAPNNPKYLESLRVETTAQTNYVKDDFVGMFKQDLSEKTIDAQQGIVNFMLGRRIGIALYNKIVDMFLNGYFPVEVNNKVLDYAGNMMDAIAYPCSGDVESVVRSKITGAFDTFQYDANGIKERVALRRGSKYYDIIRDTIQNDGFEKI